MSRLSTPYTCVLPKYERATYDDNLNVEVTGVGAIDDWDLYSGSHPDNPMNPISEIYVSPTSAIAIKHLPIATKDPTWYMYDM